MEYKYSRAHEEVQIVRGKPDKCEHCGIEGGNNNYDWASVNKKYNDVNDYIRLCRPCHCRFDHLEKNFKTGNKISEERKKYLHDLRLKNIDKHREKERNKARAWRKKNPEKAKEQDRIKRERYKAKRTEYARLYYQKHLRDKLSTL